jgi:hypothetical protein
VIGRDDSSRETAGAMSETMALMVSRVLAAAVPAVLVAFVVGSCSGTVQQSATGGAGGTKTTASSTAGTGATTTATTSTGGADAGSDGQPPRCNDGVQNGDETDVDCGGPICPSCVIGKNCNTSSDCVGMNCVMGNCQCPEGMVAAPIQGGGTDCIDLAEVTYGAYDVFYAANPPVATQDPWCGWNLTWTPSSAWPYSPSHVDYPVAYVNFCQAAAYCKFSGRRLCGRIGGGPALPSSFADFAKDQWHNACTAQGVSVYPYGNAYDPKACNGADLSTADGGPMGPEPWAALQTCIGVELIVEMSGNVAEWEDACSGSAGAGDACAVRGGSYLSGQAALRCDSGGALPTQPRSYQGPDVGFRCCL